MIKKVIFQIHVRLNKPVLNHDTILKGSGYVINVEIVIPVKIHIRIGYSIYLYSIDAITFVKSSFVYRIHLETAFSIICYCRLRLL